MIKKMTRYTLLIQCLFLICGTCLSAYGSNDSSGVELIILGTLQDAGAPHIGCNRGCCEKLRECPAPNLRIVSLGIMDHNSGESFLIEATPDISDQLSHLQRISGNRLPNGICVTHAHIGHYTGLMYLGKEALNSREMPVYCMPRMVEFLQTQGPWSQLVNDRNIELISLQDEKTIALGERIQLTALLVPHRDEYSETVGFRIEGPDKTVLFIPDIDKWKEWDRNIAREIEGCDLAFIDGTFYSADEIPHRNLDEIPHPTVSETMDLLQTLSEKERQKIHFIHFNHTNPLINLSSDRQKIVRQRGFRTAIFDQRFGI